MIMFMTKSVAVCKSSITVIAKNVSIGEDGNLSFSSMNFHLNQRSLKILLAEKAHQLSGANHLPQLTPAAPVIWSPYDAS